MELNINKNIEKLSKAGKKVIHKSKKIVNRDDSDIENDYRPLEIGFKVESKFEILRRELGKKVRIYLEELKVSGFFTDTWMWNLVFLNLLMFFISLILIINNIGKMQQDIGLNTNDDRYLDLVINKNFLYAIPLFHLVLAVGFLFFGSKSQKKLNHLFIASFFQILGIIGLELFALRDFIVYFI